MNLSFQGLDQAVWELGSQIAGWDGASVGMAMLTVRWVGLTTFAPGFSSTTVSLRFRMSIALMMAALMAPASSTDASGAGLRAHELSVLMAAEFVVGAALGLCVAMWIAAARSAGEWVALLSGLNIQTTYQPDWDGDSAESPTPIGRLFTLLGMLVFFGSRGPLRMMDLVELSLERCPLGQGTAPLMHARPEFLFDLVGESLALSIFVAWPIILAMATAQMAVILATKTRSVVLSWSLLAPTRLGIGMFILAIGFGAISLRISESISVWNSLVIDSLGSAFSLDAPLRTTNATESLSPGPPPEVPPDASAETGT